MNLSKVSTNGQITLPVEIRNALNIQSGDKILFTQNTKGDIVIQKLNSAAIHIPQPHEANQASN